MVVVEDREFLRIWGYLSQKCRKTWALVPSNKFRLLSYTIPELSLRRFQSFIYVHPTFAWISLRTSKNPLQGLCMGSALNVLFPSVFARMSPSQWEGLWSSCLYPPVQILPCLFLLSPYFLIYHIVCLPDQTVNSEGMEFCVFFSLIHPST